MTDSAPAKPAYDPSVILAPRLTVYVKENPSVKQIAALLCSKREMFFGGAGGGGKSSFLLMAALQWIDQPNYAALIVRREFTELSKAGGLIPRSHEWLHDTRAKWSEQKKQWTFPSGAVLEFGHMEHDNDRFKYGSTEYQFIGWDELTEFPSDDPYRFLFSRLRRRANQNVEIPLRVRATSNPVGPGFAWVKERFVEPGDSSRPFLPALMTDNPGLDHEEYRQSLSVLDPITRSAIEEGVWTARSPHSLFPREDVRIVEAAPADAIRRVRAWDLAASSESARARTAGVRMAKYDSATRPYGVEHVVAGRWRPAERDEVILQTARMDGPGVTIVFEIEGGSGGPAQVDSLKRRLAGYHVVGVRAAGHGSHNPDAKRIHAKVRRAGPVSTQWGVGAIVLVNDGAWKMAEFLDRVEAFSSEINIDEVDAMAMAFNYLEPTGGFFQGALDDATGSRVRGEAAREDDEDRRADERAAERRRFGGILDSGLREPD